MKKKYETPVVENLVFDYTDVVAASGNVTSQSASDGCNIMIIKTVGNCWMPNAVCLPHAYNCASKISISNVKHRQ